MTDTPTTSERLLNCPFCGGKARREDFPAEDNGDLNAGGSCISCTKCFACTAVHFDRKENLVSDWNRRPHPVPSQGEELLAAQIKHMVDRFLMWKLPDDFNPDGGISFQRMFNEHTPWPRKAEPVGTNLFDAQQAEAMVRHMLEGMPAAIAKAEATHTPSEMVERERLAKICDDKGWPNIAAACRAITADAPEREELAKPYCLLTETQAFRFSTQADADEAKRIATLLRNQSPAVGEEELAIALWREEPPNPDTALNWDYESPKRQETFRSWARRILSRLTTEQGNG